MITEYNGMFRIMRRQGECWEVWFKNFRGETMTLIATGLSVAVASTLKDNLNKELQSQVLTFRDRTRETPEPPPVS